MLPDEPEGEPAAEIEAAPVHEHETEAAPVEKQKDEDEEDFFKNLK
jgi:hypothetical protein